jgi:hypothetical protein
MNSKSNIFIGIGLVSWSLGIANYFNPTKNRPTGKWSLILGPIWDKWGASGLVGYWIAFGAILILIGYVLRRRG